MHNRSLINRIFLFLVFTVVVLIAIATLQSVRRDTETRYSPDPLVSDLVDRGMRHEYTSIETLLAHEKAEARRWGVALASYYLIEVERDQHFIDEITAAKSDPDEHVRSAVAAVLERDRPMWKPDQ